MADENEINARLILSTGTQCVALTELRGPDGKVIHPRGALGAIVHSPVDNEHAYRVRFPDGFEANLHRNQLAMLAHYQRGEVPQSDSPLAHADLYQHVIFRCVVGSQAYGLADDESDVDRRGFYLPPAAAHWSLYGVPEQLENSQTEEVYWEIQKFLLLALKANPNVLECLYSPIVEHATPLARELLDMRDVFLSKLVYQTYSGYVMSQFKKLQGDLRNRGEVKWKHVMHLLRLLLSGIGVLHDGIVPVRVNEHRQRLLDIKFGRIQFEELETWRLQLHQQFEAAYESTKLPDRPDYARVNEFLIRARRSVVGE